MLVLIALALAAQPTAPPAPAAAVVVVHDGALDAAAAAADHLRARGVAASLQHDALPASCARDLQCAARPKGRVLVVTRDLHAVRLELLDERAAVVEVYDVVVADPALVDATLAPSLDRIATRLGARAEGAPPSSDPAEAGGPGVVGAAGGVGDKGAGLSGAAGIDTGGIGNDGGVAGGVAGNDNGASPAPGPDVGPPTGETADERAAKVRAAEGEGFPTWVLPALVVGAVIAGGGALALVVARTPEGRQELAGCAGDACASVFDACLQSAVDACCQLAVDVACGILCGPSALGTAVRNESGPGPSAPGTRAGPMPY